MLLKEEKLISFTPLLYLTMKENIFYVCEDAWCWPCIYFISNLPQENQEIYFALFKKKVFWSIPHFFSILNVPIEMQKINLFKCSDEKKSSKRFILKVWNKYHQIPYCIIYLYILLKSINHTIIEFKYKSCNHIFYFWGIE